MEDLDYQITFSFLSIVAAIVGFILLINSKYKIVNGDGFLTLDEAYKINLYNRILLVIVFLAFLVINYNDYIEAKEGNSDITPYELQLVSSAFIVIATLISLYVTYKYPGNVSLENPDI